MKKMYLLPFFLGMIFSACQKDVDAPVVVTLNGYVQKGPFVMGTDVVVSELNQRFGQTGKTFVTTIKNDQGAFALQDLKLSSGNVELRANGFYYNEVIGELSAAPLALSALADVTKGASVNVNLLTHLEKSRVTYLMSNSRLPFGEARKKAQQELLAVFNIVKPDIMHSNQLSIAGAGEDHAILLAVSAVLQARRTESELTELLSRIALDLEPDGTVDDKILQSELINGATLLDQQAVRDNVTRRYNQLGNTIAVGNFEKYINTFISSTSFAFTKKITYPATSVSGRNLLSDTAAVVRLPRTGNFDWFHNTTFAASFGMAALAPAGTNVRVKLSYRVKSVYPEPYRSGIVVSTGESWKINGSTTNGVREFELSKWEAIADAHVQVNLYNKDTLEAQFEVYENSATTPTFTKKYLMTGDRTPTADDKIEYYPNTILDMDNACCGPGTTTVHGRGAMIVFVPANMKVRVKMTGAKQLTWSQSTGFNRTYYHFNGTEEVQEFESAVYDSVIGCFFEPASGLGVGQRVRLEIYENGATQPTRTKDITWY